MWNVLLTIAARLIRTWRGTPSYDELIDNICNEIRDGIPGDVTEPELGEILQDIGAQFTRRAEK